MSHLSAKCKKWIVVLAAVLVLGAAAAAALFLLKDHFSPEPESSGQEEVFTTDDPQVQEAYDNLYEVLSQYMPGFVCWGDSLTFGSGGFGTNYPNILSDLLYDNICLKMNRISADHDYLFPRMHHIDVVNMGCSGESSITILGRSGGIPFVTDDDMEIPAARKPVQVYLRSENGEEVNPLRQSDNGMDYVIIDGIRGELTIEQEDPWDDDKQYFFTRDERGEARKVPMGTTILTEGSEEYRNLIPLIFIGTNLGYESAEDLILQQRAIIDHQLGNPKDGDNARFLIIGLHLGTAQDQAELEAAMEEEYGLQYLNIREYFSTQAMEDYRMVPSEEDLENMALGMTPTSFMVEDRSHFNATGYTVLGRLIYDRMEQLGYYDEVLAAIDEVAASFQ